jgi:hypothetical protein
MTDRMVRSRMRRGAIAVRSRLIGWDTAAERLEEAVHRFTAA